MRFSDLGWNPNQFDHFGEWCPVRLGMIPVLRTTLWMFFHDLYVQNMYRIYDVCIVYVTYIYRDLKYTYIYVHKVDTLYVCCMLLTHQPFRSMPRRAMDLGFAVDLWPAGEENPRQGAGMPEKHMMTQWDITDITMDKMWNEYHQIIVAPWSGPSHSEWVQWR